MQYNKYALALVILASSAIATATSTGTVDFGKLADKIVGKQFHDLETMKQEGIITDDQAIYLRHTDLKSRDDIVRALNGCEADVLHMKSFHLHQDMVHRYCQCFGLCWNRW